MLAPNECPSARTDLDLRQAQSSLLRRAFVRYDPPNPPIYTVDPGLMRLDAGEEPSMEAHELARAELAADDGFEDG